MTISGVMWATLVHELTRRIVSGQYPVDSLVPTEAQLGEEFGVSRTVVREGTRVLAARGLVAGRRGLGTVVQPPSAWRTFDPDVLAARLEVGDRNVVLREVFVLRRSIEPELAAGAARLADDVGLAQLGSKVAQLEAAKFDPSRYIDCDGEFHEFIAKLAGVALLRDILLILDEPLKIQRTLTGQIPGGSPALSHAQHLEIFHCILNHDEVGAREAMLEHLLWAEERLDRILTTEESHQTLIGTSS